MTMVVEETQAGTKYLRCDCTKTEIRYRTRNNGAEAYVIQCLTCGREMRQIKKTDPEVRFLIERKPFDETLPDAWQRKLRLFGELQTQQRKEKQEEENEAWWRKYSMYLKTPQWKEKRRLVLERDKGICQGCLRNRATQAHHLTYDHVFNEFLFELIAVCDACHRRIHPRNV
jgi:hypothetical protein